MANYYLFGELKARVKKIVDHYNARRYHKTLNNLTPQDIFLKRGNTILEKRNDIKLKTMVKRKRLQHQTMAA